MTNDELTKLANRIYDLAMSKSISATPVRVTDPNRREIWQTEYIDKLLNNAILGSKIPTNGLPLRIQQMVPNDITPGERGELMKMIYDWNHEHELEEQPVYILNPDYRP